MPIFRRCLEFLAAGAFVAFIVSLLTPMGKSWEWFLAGSSIIVLYFCTRIISRVSKTEDSVTALNRPDRNL